MAWAAGDFRTQPKADQLGGAGTWARFSTHPNSPVHGGGFRHPQTDQLRGARPSRAAEGGASGGTRRRRRRPAVGVDRRTRYISCRMEGVPLGPHHHGPHQRYILTTMGPDPAADPHGPVPRCSGGPSPVARGGGGCQKGRRGRGGRFSTHPDLSTHPNSPVRGGSFFDTPKTRQFTVGHPAAGSPAAPAPPAPPCVSERLATGRRRAGAPSATAKRRRCGRGWGIEEVVT